MPTPGYTLIALRALANHVGRMLAKLGLTSRVQAVIFAYETRLATPGAPLA